MDDCAFGVEISEDRRHTAVVAAGTVDDTVVVDLVAYRDGTDAVPAVADLVALRTVVAVVIDPHSPAATLIRPVTDAGVKVTTPSTSDVVVAHGLFLDTLATGRLRHTGQAELTAAVRFGTERRVGGGTAWERRGAPVDVAPLTAATLAVWGWLYRPPAPVEPWAMWM